MRSIADYLLFVDSADKDMVFIDVFSQYLRITLLQVYQANCFRGGPKGVLHKVFLQNYRDQKNGRLSKCSMFVICSAAHYECLFDSDVHQSLPSRGVQSIVPLSYIHTLGPV